MKKSLAAAAMAASLTIGGGAGVALFSPTLSAAQEATTDENTENDKPERGERLREILQPLVDDGTITGAQADAVVERLLEEAPERRHRPGQRGPRARHQVGQVLSEVLGMDREELREAFEDGMTIREIAEQQGVDPQDVVDAIVAAADERLSEAVEDGRITEEEKAEKLADIEEKATEGLDREPGDRPDGPNGPNGGDDG